MKNIYIPGNKILREFIEHITYFKNTNTENRFIPVIPDGMTELVISPGNTFERKSGKDTEVNVINSSHFIGIKSKFHYMKPGKVKKTICIRFKPGAVGLFTDLKFQETSDKVIDACELFSRDIRELEDKTCELSDERLIIDETEKFLLKNLKVDRKILNFIELVKMIYKSPEDSKLNLLKNASGLEYKQLERIFRKHLGLQPKLFLNIVKFNFATKLIIDNPDSHLTQIALQSGYYDQPHFIKAFRQFSGNKPKDFFSLNSKWSRENQMIINNQFR